VSRPAVPAPPGVYVEVRAKGRVSDRLRVAVQAFDEEGRPLVLGDARLGPVPAGWRLGSDADDRFEDDHYRRRHEEPVPRGKNPTILRALQTVRECTEEDRA